MKKYGKFEKRIAKAETKREKEHNPLLQTYFSSLLSLVLCVAMFFGTSYAWFSSEVQSTGNEIYVGILKVELEKLTDADTWVPMSAVTAEGQSANKLYDGSIRWEPGYTSLETIRIVDKGDLAFTYVLTFLDGTISDTQNANYYEGKSAAEMQTALKEAAKWFDIWVFDHQQENTEYIKPASYADIQAQDSGWKYVGTLEEVLAGEPVLNGKMGAAQKPYSETLQAEEQTAKYTIAMHMNGEMVEAGEEQALNSLMGKKLTLNVKLVASQTSAEQDGTGNMYYDQVVTNAEDLKLAFRNGGTIGLAADIKASDISTLAAVPADKTVELYLNGHSIHVELAEGTNSSEVFYVNQGGKLTIYGDQNSLVHAKAADSRKTNALINNCGGTVVINGGQYTMEYDSDSQKQLIPTLIDNNSTLGEAVVVINDGIFRHTRNMFRNFANHQTAVASITINGGEFYGSSHDYGTIWNQQPSGDIPVNAGIVRLNGGSYTCMNVCTGFTDDLGQPAGVTVGEGAVNLTLGTWLDNGAEWTANIEYAAIEDNED